MDLSCTYLLNLFIETLRPLNIHRGGELVQRGNLVENYSSTAPHSVVLEEILGCTVLWKLDSPTFLWGVSQERPQQNMHSNYKSEEL